MPDIATVTINPAVDVSTSVERIVPVAKLRGTSQRRDPGGGGINVARVIKRLGGRGVRAIYPVGGATGDLLRRLLDAESVDSQTFQIAGETREDFFVHEQSTALQYRFILPGPTLVDREWSKFLQLIASLDPFPRFVVASGSLPGGVPDDFYARMAAITKRCGSQIILDTSGAALAAAVADGVDLIKPNLREMRELTGTEPRDAGEWVAAARRIVEMRQASIVALTMGHLGAALVTRDRTWRAKSLPIIPQSAVGAGDSFLGALVLRLASGTDLGAAFRYAMAAGAAALLNPGTELCRTADVERLAEQVVIEET
ncbi:1-phosphofructokinase family hexose kinase [Bradyrhizobium frederickii]|uniref:Phosphofructokinase n=1 Tax=Bradyrhizobium frederickii TaxID=2560054 RepID=A0A4Y9LBX2_9BRAD|nr:1-phosphofructokinase family hexose kinase [Bradyrhizobium frederickii]TFV41001.1 1-phosphofructokinase family hexose kinase [Bradyrhizobium frederickii]